MQASISTSLHPPLHPPVDKGGRYPCPLDFARAWHDCTAQDPTHRGDAQVDLAFWREHAAGYDTDSTRPSSFEQTLAFLGRHVLPHQTLLDVGAGAGRFSLPLARLVGAVTALDHARPMLEILETKARKQGLSNIRLVESAWEDAVVERHDVVLAAWSLYRLPDMLRGMQKLVETTHQTLIIITGAGHSHHHEPPLRGLWPTDSPGETPMHIYFYGVLWQLGIHAELQIVMEHRRVWGKTKMEVVRQIVPESVAGALLDEACARMDPHLISEGDGWSYLQPMPVGVLVWHRETTSGNGPTVAG